MTIRCHTFGSRFRILRSVWFNLSESFPVASIRFLIADHEVICSGTPRLPSAKMGSRKALRGVVVRLGRYLLQRPPPWPKRVPQAPTFLQEAPHHQFSSRSSTARLLCEELPTSSHNVPLSKRRWAELTVCCSQHPSTVLQPPFSAILPQHFSGTMPRTSCRDHKLTSQTMAVVLPVPQSPA